MSEVSQPPKSDDTVTLSRRRFLQGSLAAAAAASVPFALSNCGSEAATAQPKAGDALSAPAEGKRPNILILMCDEMRFPPVYESEALKAFRQQFLPTQNLLRENGIEFTRHYAASTACVPSRACLVTGHYPSLHGVSQTYAGAKEACDPQVIWLDPNTVPTFGNYFRAAGYRTYWKGKWHVSDADMYVPGTHTPLLSFDAQTGARDPDKEALYVAADRLGPYGFAGWIGPEPHGPNPLRDTGSSAFTEDHGRDVAYAEQTVELIQELNRDADAAPWLIVSSFVNPHDIAEVSQPAIDSGVFDFHVEDIVPPAEELFLPEFEDSFTETLENKPKAQKSYRDSQPLWGSTIPDTAHYRRFYYQVHKNLDEQMAKVMDALLASRFSDDTIVIFTSDHGEMLGSHGDMHQKMYQAYDETTHVPLLIWNKKLFTRPQAIETLTSHIDFVPTLLGLAGIDPEPVRQQLARNHSDARPLAGRDLSGLILGQAGPDQFADPVYYMTEDDINTGLHMGDAQGITRPPVADPKRVETVVARLPDGTLWKYSRYYDSPQYWTSPGVQDVLLSQKQPTPAPEYAGPLDCEVAVKGTPVAEEFELYDLINDPMELDNKHNNPGYSSQQQQMEKLLAEQRKLMRLSPISGEVPGQAVNA